MTPGRAPSPPTPRSSRLFGRTLRRGGVRPPAVEDLEGRVVCSGLAAAGGPAAQVAERSVGLKGPGALRLANLVYTDPGTRPRVLDVYRPAGPAPPGGWPVVLAIHGGGWRKFDKEQYAAKVAAPLLARGFAVVAPDYTLSAPGSPSWPAPFVELQQAVRWIRARAGALGLDPSRVAAMGESAGAHLALMLGTDPAGPETRVQAVIDFFGPADLTSLRVQSPAAKLAIDQLLGPASSVDASPVAHVSRDDPPVLIVQGTADILVPPAQSRALAAALTAAGVPNTLVLIPGAAHGFGLQVGRRSLLPSLVSFLNRAQSIRAVCGAGAGTATSCTSATLRL